MKFSQELCSVDQTTYHKTKRRRPVTAKVFIIFIFIIIFLFLYSSLLLLIPPLLSYCATKQSESNLGRMFFANFTVSLLLQIKEKNIIIT